MDARDHLGSKPLRVGLSTRALFDLEEEHRVFMTEGVQAYAALQLERENTLVGKGTGFEVVERLLALNEKDEAPFVEVVLLSQNSPDLSLRAFHSIDEGVSRVRIAIVTTGNAPAHAHAVHTLWALGLGHSGRRSSLRRDWIKGSDLEGFRRAHLFR